MMNLPVDFHWIPGYENRYAMCVSPDSGVVIDQVYSAAYPGATKGMMITLQPKSYSPKTFVLSKAGGKETFRLSHLQKLVLGNIANRRRFRGTTTAEAASDVGRDEPEGVTRALNQAKMADEMGLPQSMPSEKCWMVGWRDGDDIRFDRSGSGTDRYPTLTEAELSAISLAKSNPGVEYFVVTTVSKIVTGGVTRTSL